MRLRLAGPADAGAVADLLNRLIDARDGTALREAVTAEQERALILRPVVEGSFLLAEDDAGVLLGFQSTERAADVAEIGTFVTRAARAQGVGRALLAGTLAWAQAQGVGTLRAVVAADNLGGQRAYRAWGFRGWGFRAVGAGQLTLVLPVPPLQ